MSIKRIILPKKTTEEPTNRPSDKNINKKDPWRSRNPRVFLNAVPPAMQTSNFEKGSKHKCLTTFKGQFSTFYQNELLEVIGNKRYGGSKNLDIIFVNCQNREKKFWTLLHVDVESNETIRPSPFQRIG